MFASRKNKFFKLLAFLPVVAIAVVLACTGGGAKEKPKYNFKDGAGPNGAVAVIDGQPISDQELVGDQQLEFYEARSKIYELQMDRIGEILIQRSYGEKAKKAKMPLTEYITKKVFKGPPKISDKEYKKFVKDRKIPKAQMNDQLKERIMRYLQAQKEFDRRKNLVAKLSKKHKVDIYFKKPKVNLTVEIGQAPTFGPADAKVKIVEFSDYQCPFCSKAADVVNEIKKKYGNKVQVAFKNYPLPNHPEARPASEAGMCINEQNSKAFWKYHDKLFQNQRKLDVASLKEYAKGIKGIDMKKFNECFDSKKYAKLVQDDLDYGAKLGVRSTPTFFINGRVISGALPFENFKEIIDEELGD